MVGGLVGVALIAAVGLASRAHTPAGGGHTRSIGQDILMEYLLLLSVALAVVVLPVAVYLFIAGREEERPALPARKNWMMALLVSMIVLSVVAVLLLRYLHDHHGAHDNPVSQLAGLAKNGSRTAGAVRFDWGPVIVVSILAVVALAAAAWFVVQHRRVHRGPAPTPGAELAARARADDRRPPRRARPAQGSDRRVRADGAGARGRGAPAEPGRGAARVPRPGPAGGRRGD